MIFQRLTDSLGRRGVLKPYYETNLGKLYNCDCIEFMKTLDAGSVDLVLTDPPYLLPGMKGAGCFGGRDSLTGTKGFTDMGFDTSILNQFANWMCFCSRHNIVEVLSQCKARWNILHWCKPNPVPTCNNKYLSDIEYCVHNWTKGRLFGEFKDKSLFMVLPCGNKETKHPNEKPLKLMYKLLRNGSQEQDLIFDPFAGSGTTAVACERLNRRWIACELDPEYCELAKKRIAKEAEQLKLF